MYFLFSHVLLPHTELANSILKTLQSFLVAYTVAVVVLAPVSLLLVLLLEA